MGLKLWEVCSRYAPLLALVTAVPACGPESGSARSRAATEVDTVNGVEHVTYVGESAAGTPPGLRVDSAGVVEIGAVEGADPYVFGQISGVVVGADGRIYVADDQAKEVRIFTPDGHFVGRFGRAGEGPGEFRNLGGLGRTPSGEIAVVDGGLGRASLFSPDGDHRRSFRLERPFRLIRHGVPVHFDSAGRFYDLIPLSRAATVDSTGVVRYAADGAVEQTILLWAREPRQITIMEGGRPMASLSIPFAPHPRAAIDSRGRVYTTAGDEYSIALIGTSGDTLRVLRRHVEGVPIGGASRDSARNALAERYVLVAGAEPRDLPELPEQMPPILALEVDTEDNLWVLRPASDASTMTWDVFDAEGAFVGGTRLPAMRVMHIGERTIAGVVYDEMQVPRVRVVPRR